MTGPKPQAAGGGEEPRGLERRLAELQATERALRARLKQQAAVAELGRIAIAQDGSSKLIEAIPARLCRAFDVEFSKILQCLEGEESLLLRSGVGWRSGLAGTAKVPAGKNSQAGATLLSKAPLLVEDLRTESRFSGPDLLLEHGIVSGMSVVIQGPTGPWGVLGVHASQPRRFSKEEAEVLQAIANLLTNALARTAAEEALRQSEARWRSLTDSSPDHVMLIDREGRILYINHPVPDLTREEVLGRSMYDFVPPGSKQAAVDCFKRVIRSRQPNAYTTDYVTTEGKRHVFSVRVGPVIEAGQVTSLVSVSTDVTHETELERQLRQSQKLEAIGTLAGGIAHDFNNMLQPILGFTRLARDTLEEGSAIRPYLDEVIASGQRAVELVGHILTYSRQGKVERQVLRLQPVMEEVLKLLGGSLPSSVRIQSSINADCGPVRANETEIHQVLMNLCTNAFHAMEQSGGLLEVGLEQRDLDEDGATRLPPLEAGPYARLSVRDSGPGISPEALDRIFDPYFTTRESGSGLGLSLAIGIVTANKGAMNVVSELGSGTLFEVYLPLCGAAELPAEGPSSRPKSARGSARLLFVDDEPAIVKMARRGLSRLGFELTCFTESPKALEAFRQAPDSFDVLVSDLTMPSLSGLSLIREVRKIRPDLPVILCSGYSDQLEAAQAKDTGIACLLEKPYLIEDLAKAILSACAGT